MSSRTIRREVREEGENPFSSPMVTLRRRIPSSRGRFIGDRSSTINSRLVSRVEFSISPRVLSSKPGNMVGGTISIRPRIVEIECDDNSKFGRFTESTRRGFNGNVKDNARDVWIVSKRIFYIQREMLGIIFRR